MGENRNIRVVIIGAGMTGRGHIAQLVHESGWKITFVERDPELVKILKDKTYTVRLISKNTRDVVISGYDIFSLDSKPDIYKAIAEADLVITSVLPNNLSSVAPILAECLRFRLLQKNAVPKKMPLNVVAAENMNNGSSALWLLTSNYLSFDEKQEFGRSFGFPNSMIARVVPRSSDPLLILTEDYNEWTADKLSRVGNPPPLDGLEWVDNQEARLKRKLYIHNTGHGVCAYLGVLRGYKFIHESARDQWIMSYTKAATAESGDAVAREFGFDTQQINNYAQSLIDRLPLDALPDSIDRVVREPIRKLGAKDRFLGPLSLCEKYDLPRHGLCMGIAAVLAAKPLDDEGYRLSAIVHERGPIGAINEVSRYTPDIESEKLIEEYYELLISGKLE